jgi:hypothetical protein
MLMRRHDALVAAGIEIPFPQQDLHIRSIDSKIKMAIATPISGGE